jgi:hypothetical protein
VAGYFRTQLVYRLFSEDLIETLGTAEGMEEEGAFRELLCRRVEKATGFDGLLVRRTLGDFIARGFLKAVPEKAGRRWIWTHNNRVDVWS